MSSILTNNSAMVALQTLKSINSDLSKTQSMISTGKEVASAKDNSAIWAISKVMESDVQGFKAISESLSLGESSVAVARNGAETVTDLLNSMKEKIVAAKGENVDRTKLQADVARLEEYIYVLEDQNSGLADHVDQLERSAHGHIGTELVDVTERKRELDV